MPRSTISSTSTARRRADASSGAGFDRVPAGGRAIEEPRRRYGRAETRLDRHRIQQRLQNLTLAHDEAWPRAGAPGLVVGDAHVGVSLVGAALDQVDDTVQLPSAVKRDVRFAARWIAAASGLEAKAEFDEIGDARRRLPPPRAAATRAGRRPCLQSRPARRDRSPGRADRARRAATARERVVERGQRRRQRADVIGRSDRSFSARIVSACTRWKMWPRVSGSRRSSCRRSCRGSSF